MTVLNELDRFHLAMDAAKWAGEKPLQDRVRVFTDGKLKEHRAYILEHGEDMPEVRDWKWKSPSAATLSRVEEASEESFPASDAPASWTGIDEKH